MQNPNAAVLCGFRHYWKAYLLNTLEKLALISV